MYDGFNHLFCYSYTDELKKIIHLMYNVIKAIVSKRIMSSILIVIGANLLCFYVDPNLFHNLLVNKQTYGNAFFIFTNIVSLFFMFLELAIYYEEKND